ncbi:hypothetical protein QBC38DRAFT_471299 [Podospora fimiseda]|uniref:Ribonucleases P/MRP subunit Pop8-like domain-containing protein n=1 Tax=Podospora fimiseda TaxID=252190 RepID=A0AAN7H5Q5_9PEZI|nr:hypothetical protein QBC38DRAFT_471299 [Podospora fimiseda]
MSPTPMDLDIPKYSKTLTQQTISSPPFSYIHLSTSTHQNLDNLLLRSYLTSALRQFLGDTGVAIPVDILSCTSSQAWIRVPRQDLGAFAGAITSFSGQQSLLLQIKACGDFLGSLIGKGGKDDDEWDVWKS